jgi:hypothetical protein
MFDDAVCPVEWDIANDGDTADNRSTASSIRLQYVLFENMDES